MGFREIIFTLFRRQFCVSSVRPVCVCVYKGRQLCNLVSDPQIVSLWQEIFLYGTEKYFVPLQNNIVAGPQLRNFTNLHG